MSRITDPICNHLRKGRVTSIPPDGKYVPGEGHAATNVCHREACIEDAKFWVRAISGKEAHHIPDGAR